MAGTQRLRQVVSTLKMVPVLEGVIIPFVPQHVGEDGTLRPSDVMAAGADAMLAELAKLTRPLRAMRMAGA
ncbi:hypothetical protein [Nonomuraea candida]|uniref:hypothetical protein n=1 Tax=Nonomuraea candida TaxID=359159 RepID=UPI001B804132|nr:hypothetical protein [Nonomuraea candida]